MNKLKRNNINLIINTMECMDEDVKLEDVDWIDNYLTLEKEYISFYKEPISYINCKFIYLNDNFEIEKIKKNIHYLQEKNKILTQELISIIKQNNSLNHFTYKIFDIVIFNIDIEPINIKTLFNKQKNNGNKYLINVTNKTEDVVLYETIQYFEDINEIIFVFMPKKISFNKTKKIKN
jgi:hypothetical protein